MRNEFRVDIFDSFDFGFHTLKRDAVRSNLDFSCESVSGFDSTCVSFSHGILPFMC